MFSPDICVNREKGRNHAKRSNLFQLIDSHRLAMDNDVVQVFVFLIFLFRIDDELNRRIATCMDGILNSEKERDRLLHDD